MLTTTLLTVLLLSKLATASSSKCKNLEVDRIALCCAIDELYSETTKLCLEIPKFAFESWLELVFDNCDLMEVVEYGECNETTLASSEPAIDSCYSPDFDAETDEMFIKEYVNIPCERSVATLDNSIYDLLAVIFALSPAVLPGMILCACTRKRKADVIMFRLLTCYFMSVALSQLTTMVRVYITVTEDSLDSPWLYLVFLPKFFTISHSLWLSVIGYEVWKGFKVTNIELDGLKTRKQFICYSLYVWGIGAAVLLCSIVVGKRFPGFFDISMYILAVFSVTTFLMMSVNIALIRWRVYKLSYENVVYTTIFTIFRLCLLMGIPGVMVLLLKPLIGYLPLHTMQVVEPYLVYGAFMAGRENGDRCRWQRCSWCCRRNAVENDETNDAIVDMTTTA